MALRAVILCLFLFLCVYSDGAGTPFCTPANNAQMAPSYKAPPGLDTTAFSIKIQGTVLDTYGGKTPYTFYAREYYDYTANAVKIVQEQNGTEMGIIMDHETGSSVMYKYADAQKSSYTCEVIPIADAGDNLHVFGQSAAVAGDHIVRARHVFGLDADVSHIEYKGTATIDGIQVDHWQECKNWTDDKDVFKVDYYFTKENWIPPKSTTPMAVPVRMEIAGVKQFNGQSVDIHHIYEYLDYTPTSSLHPNLLAIPDGMTCMDIMKLRVKPFPTIPSNLNYMSEVTLASGQVLTVDVLYNYDKKMVAMRQTGRVTIHDFNTGVGYIIDKMGGQCTRQPLKSGFDSIVEKNLTLRMATTAEAFGITESILEYRGVVLYNSIPSDSWIGFEKLPDGGQIKLEVFALVSSSNSRSSMGSNPIVGIKKQNMTFSIVDWSMAMATGEDLADISLCHTDSEVKNVRVVFEAAISDTFSSSIAGMTKLKSDIALLIATAGRISPVQVVPMDLTADSQSKKVFWTGKIFSPEDAKYRAENLQNPIPSVSIGVAWQTIEDNILRGALSVDVPLTSSNISLIAREIQDLDADISLIEKTANPLDAFVKHIGQFVVDATIVESYSNFTVGDCAAACLASQEDCNGFTFASSLCELVFKPSYPESSFVQIFGSDFYTRNYAQYFNQMPGYFTKPSTGGQSVPDLSHCANTCMSQGQGACVAIDVCPSTSGGVLCYMYGSRELREGSTTTAYQSCQRYNKQYILDYSMEALSVLETMDSNLLMLTESNADACAAMCSNVVTCTTFSYCPGSQSCRLLRRYVGDIKTKPSNGCAVYKSIVSGVQSGLLTASDDTGYSSSNMTALGIVMLLLALGGTAGALWILSKRGVISS